MNVFSDALKSGNGKPLQLHHYVDSRSYIESEAASPSIEVERQSIFDAVLHDSKFPLLVTLLLGGVSPNVKRPSDGATPLHVAIINHPERLIPSVLEIKLHTFCDVRCANRLIMSFLLENGADVNAVALGGETPLMVACASHNIAAVKLLLEKGGDLDARDCTGRTCLSYAAPYPSVLLGIKDFLGEEVFKQKLESEYMLHQICQRPGCRIAALFLIEYLGFDVNRSARKIEGSGWKPLRDGFTPLHCAVLSGDLSMVKALVSVGADIQQKDICGVSPLALAANSTLEDVRASLGDAFITVTPLDPSGIKHFLSRYACLPSSAARDKLSTHENPPILFSPISLAMFLMCATIPHIVIYYAAQYQSSILHLLVCGTMLFLYFSMNKADACGYMKRQSLSQRPIRCLGWLLGVLYVGGKAVSLLISEYYLKAYNFRGFQFLFILLWLAPSIGLWVTSFCLVFFRHPGSAKSTPGQRKGIFASLANELHRGKLPKSLQYSVDWELMVKLPMRAQRCCQTNQIILRYDGFAPIIASCIGARNHRAYISFQVGFLSVMIWCYYFMVYTWGAINAAAQKYKDAPTFEGIQTVDALNFKNSVQGRFWLMYTQMLLPSMIVMLIVNLLTDILNICANLTRFDSTHADSQSSLYCFKLKDTVYSLYDRGWRANAKGFFLLQEDFTALSYRPPVLSDYLKKKVTEFQKTELLLSSTECACEGDEGHSRSGVLPSVPPQAAHYHTENEEGAVTATTMPMGSDQMLLQSLFQEIVQNGAITSSMPINMTIDKWEGLKSTAQKMHSYFQERKQMSGEQQRV